MVFVYNLPPRGEATPYYWVTEGGGRTFFGFAKHCLVSLCICYLVQDQYIFAVVNEKI